MIHGETFCILSSVYKQQFNLDREHNEKRKGTRNAQKLKQNFNIISFHCRSDLNVRTPNLHILTNLVI